MKIQKVNKSLLMDFEDIKKSKSKFSQMEKITVLMKEDQKIFLDSLAKIIMKNREKNIFQERIIANSILRCLICLLIDRIEDLDFSNIKNEQELCKVLENLVVISYDKSKL